MNGILHCLDESFNNQFYTICDYVRRADSFCKKTIGFCVLPLLYYRKEDCLFISCLKKPGRNGVNEKIKKFRRI
jgi:hypothetical protein